MLHWLITTLFLVAVLQESDAVTTSDCRTKNLDTKYPVDIVGGRCYQIINETMTWQDADKYCQSKNGWLAVVDSAYVQGKVNTIANDRTSGQSYGTDWSLWVGLQDFNQFLEWKWVDGKSARLGQDYTNWAPGQPGGGYLWFVENCGAMRSNQNWLWHDYPCNFPDVKFPFMCEFQIPENIQYLRKTDVGKVCQSKTARTQVRYVVDGAYERRYYSLVKYDSNYQNPKTVLSVNAANQYTSGTDYTNRVTAKSTQGSGSKANEYEIQFDMENVQVSDEGYYGVQVQYVEFLDQYPTGNQDTLVPTIQYSSYLTVLVPPATDFVFTVCRKATTAICKNVGVGNTLTTSYRAFQISSLSDVFSALCTIPDDAGRPSGSLGFEINGVAFSPDASFPKYIFMQRSVEQILSEVGPSALQTIMVKCKLTTDATACLSKSSDATKIIQISGATNNQNPLALFIMPIVFALAKFSQ